VPGGAGGAVTAGKPDGGVSPGAVGASGAAGAETMVSPAVGPAWCPRVSTGAAAPVATVRSAVGTGRACTAAVAARARSPLDG
jgi:hypothetical protein